MKFLRLLFIQLLLSAAQTTVALDGPTPVRTFGPTGLEIEAQDDGSILVTNVAAGSPADGKVNKGTRITEINGRTIPTGFWESRKHLGGLIAEAEAQTGLLAMVTDKGKVEVRIPTMGHSVPPGPLPARRLRD